MQRLKLQCATAVLVGLSLIAPLAARADVLWAENAENGYGNVIDGTAGSYSLIQSSVVGDGSHAFHLAHPNATSNWFVLDRTISIQPNTSLYFLSQLSWATSDQVAQVQISSDGGATWPTTIYSQPGTGGAGEGNFSLRQVDLSSYANQDLRFRFNYHIHFGSYFPQSDPGVGWHVDNIQIATEFAKAQYSIGNPSAHEQLYLEYINRARADALVEASRLANSTNPDIVSAYESYNIAPANIVGQFEYSVSNGILDQHAQPLSFNERLNTMAKLHSQDMYTNEFQGHVSSNNPPSPFVPNGGLIDRINAVGYNGGVGENVYAYAESVEHGHAAFDVDWGLTSNLSDPNYVASFAGQGMQNPAGHRNTIHNGVFKEVGVGVINGTNGDVGPQIVTQNFGDPGDATFITGVVFDDQNSNAFYDLNEGRAGIRIDVDGAAYFAISSGSGGYSVPVPGDGVYEVTFSGGGFASYSTTVSVVGGLNVKVDYLVSTIVAGDFNGDGNVDGADFVIWQTNFPNNSGTATLATGDANGDGNVDGADFVVWQTNFPTTSGGITPVPEPAAWISASLALAGLCCLRRRAR